MDKKTEQDFINLLNNENSKLRIAGCEMAEAAINIIKNYDGVHRLSLAVSKWFKVIADENGRGNL